MQGDYRQLPGRIGRRLACNGRFQKALGHQVGKAPVGCSGMGVVVHRQPEVSPSVCTVRCSGCSRVLPRAQQLDHGQRQIGKPGRVGQPARAQEAVKRQGIGQCGQLHAMACCQQGDAVPAARCLQKTPQ